MPEISRYAIREWIINVATGEFHYKNVLGLNSKLTPSDDNKLRRIIHECAGGKDGKQCKAICEPIGRHDGYYRPIQDGAMPLDWQELEARRDSGLILPFGLRKYVFIYPDTTTVIAGSKSSGKTGFLYRTVVLNMNRTNVVLLSNLEGGLNMLRDRFFSMDIVIPNPAPFKVINVVDHFHDYIKEKNTIYVIDYIDAPEGTDFFMIGGLINKVDKKLQGLNSVAVIGLQKPSFRDIAIGGENTLKAATLYLAMDNKKLKIVDAKVPAVDKTHPKNMAWVFDYEDEGTKFTNITPYYGE